MNEELNLVFKYCNVNKLSINFTKTTYMIISSARLRSYIHIPNIAHKTQIKYLGIYIDQTLHWEPQIQHINNKLAKKKKNYSQIKIIFCRSSYTEKVILFFHLSIPILSNHNLGQCM